MTTTQPTEQKQTTETIQGFRSIYTGTLRNVRVVQRQNKNNTKQWVENILDLEHLTKDGQPFLVEIKLSKTAQDAGVFALLKPLVGKLLTFDLFISNRCYQDRVYSDYYYTQTTVPKIVR